jgi:uncharacterized repeat protein (TIGR03803 family)
VLHSFQGGNDGRTPEASLIVDSNGNLYGTTPEGGASGYGTVFEVSPPATRHGDWNETVLYSFKGGSDGINPYASLFMDSGGNLYGTTWEGGGAEYVGGSASGYGTVFELSPPATAGSSWTETVLYAFAGGRDGGNPRGALVAHSKGIFYGTPSEGGPYAWGTVFELWRTPTIGVCSHCRSPVICCACAGGIWSGNQCN